MKTVGIRELQDGLGDYVREAQGGETILVTDGGKPVAQLSPVPVAPAPEPVNDEHPLAEYARKRGGTVRLGKPLDPDVKAAIDARRIGPPILKGVTVQEILDEMREDTR